MTSSYANPMLPVRYSFSKLNLPQLKELRRKLSWSVIRSWQVAPITCYSDGKDKTVLGIYKILTSKFYLSAAHMAFIKAIAEWAFYHYRQYQENNTLHALNKMSNELAVHATERLTQEANRQITDWLNDYIRVECQFL